MFYTWTNCNNTCPSVPHLNNVLHMDQLQHYLPVYSTLNPCSTHEPSSTIFIRLSTEDPQEMCHQCGSTFLASNQQVVHGHCRSCLMRLQQVASEKTRPGDHPRSRSFSIESLVSPTRPTDGDQVQNKSIAKGPSPQMDIRNYNAYYANAMMSAGLIPMVNCHLDMAHWPQPLPSQYGI